MREPGAEALSSRACEAHPDRVLGQTRMGVARGDLAGQHGAGGAVDILDRQIELDRLLVLDGLAAKRDELLVEDFLKTVILPLGIVDGDLGWHLRLMEDAAEIEALGLPVIYRLALVEDFGLANHFGEGAEAERGHVFAHLFRDEEEIIDNVLGLALE